MSNDSGSPPKQPGTTDYEPDPQFMKRFDEVISSYAEATSSGNTGEAQAAAIQALAMCAEEGLRNPDPDVLLMNEADDLERKGEWSSAEAVRRKLLASKESSGNFAMIAAFQMNLSGLLRLVGRLDEAWDFARAATVSGRHLKVNFFPLVMALLNQAACALERGDSAEAKAAASEAVQVIEPGKLYDNMRARALITRARCFLAVGDPTDAEADLASAWEALEEYSGSFMMPGTISALANWWEAKSQLEEQLGNLWRAREAIMLAIEHRRRSENPHALVALARDLEKLDEISRGSGHPEGEEGALCEAKSICEQLHLPVRG